jgi:hypothetical protein
MGCVMMCSAVIFTGCQTEDTGVIVDNGTMNNRNYTISGNASGTQMVPAVQGNGMGTITGTFNPTTNVLTYTANWSNLTGAPTRAAFYNGATGQAGTMMGTQWTLGTGLTGTGSMSGTMTLTPQQASQLTSGNWYWSLGTGANANGEIRGQITATR